MDQPNRTVQMRPAGMTITPLTEVSRQQVLDHLLRLSDEDRYMRFLRDTSDAAIEAHVAALDFDDAVRLGIHDGFGALIAMVEGFVLARGAAMEVAFSTDAAWRRLGLARSLSESIAAVACRRGIDRIVASCSARNVAMRALLNCLSAETERDAGDVSATWRPQLRAGVGADVTRLPCPLSFDRRGVVSEDQTAQRLFATLPLGAPYAERLVPALATGLLVAMVEAACIAEMQPFLTDDETVVGARVDVCHLAPALPGHELRLRGTGRWCEGRQAAFDVVVEDGFGRVATAHVVMAIVGAARFAAGLARKQEHPTLLAA